MAEETRIADALSDLNNALDGITPYRLALVDPASVRHVDKNAHYMPTKVYRRLVNNVKQDGNLSSLPFCWKDEEGKLVALSGNHRVDAARDAGVKSILVLYTDQHISRSEQIAVQLSHNAIVGADNKQVLRELWDEIMDLEFKQYTGLDETLLETVDASSLERLRVQQLPMETITLFFLPAEVGKVQAVLKALGEVKGEDGERYAARLEDFSRFFNVLVNTKEAENIVNSATAMLRICEIMEEYLAAKKAAEEEKQKAPEP